MKQHRKKTENGEEEISEEIIVKNSCKVMEYIKPHI